MESCKSCIDHKTCKREERQTGKPLFRCEYWTNGKKIPRVQYLCQYGDELWTQYECKECGVVFGEKSEQLPKNKRFFSESEVKKVVRKYRCIDCGGTSKIALEASEYYSQDALDHACSLDELQDRGFQIDGEYNIYPPCEDESYD